ncbi:MAG: DinB family protein [Phycisphaeraceae bacterium]|nr:DinB family protein [Phycisphaeraceae bacterium]MCW5754552.1 DinB family protein [Phycisphaeraceae bacterium]
MSVQDVLAEAVTGSRMLLERYLPGFDESNRTTQAPNLPNHLIWTLGHLALTMERCAGRVKGSDVPKPLSEGSWVTGKGRSGDIMRFDTESVAFKSTPLDEPSLYPSLARGREIFGEAIDALSDAVRQASDAALMRSTKWGTQPIRVCDMVMRMVFHNGVHAGQITDLRRALRMPQVLS